MKACTVDVWEFEYKEDFGSALLVEGEIQQASLIPLAPIRKRFEQTRTSLRKVLSHYVNKDPLALGIGTSPGGKPYLEGEPSVEFSLSHSGGSLVIAVHAKAVGVDLECGAHTRDPLAVADRFFSDRDARYLHALPTQEQQRKGFLEQWVAKEAALKVEGWGIAGKLRFAECEYCAGKIAAVCLENHLFSVEFPALRCGMPAAVAWNGREKCEVNLLRESDLSA